MNQTHASSVTLPPWLWPRAAYVHVPFCAHHCCYCDFAVVAGRDDAIDQYLEALAADMATLFHPQPVDTLFLGGGTPTHLPRMPLERLLGLLLKWHPLLPDHEFSVEANPATLTSDTIALLADHGVNRVSLGAQSFDAAVLATLERDHSADDVRRAVDLVRARIANVSLDLIFGAPGQAIDAWEADLRRAIALGIGHLSTYGLTYEKGTRLWKDRQQGRVQALGEETELQMYLLAIDFCESAGLQQYEISSFARPGQRCRHNQVYWANHAYFGFGLGAARYYLGQRETATRDLKSYMRKANAGESVAMHSELLDPQERARETISLNLRRADGLARAAFHEQTGFDFDALAGERLPRLRDQGLLIDDGACVRLSRQGKCVADAVMAEFLKNDR
jgi:oxygen-independent coproporphyrinogen III oxidase